MGPVAVAVLPNQDIHQRLHVDAVLTKSPCLLIHRSFEHLDTIAKLAKLRVHVVRDLVDAQQGFIGEIVDLSAEVAVFLAQPRQGLVVPVESFARRILVILGDDAQRRWCRRSILLRCVLRFIQWPLACADIGVRTKVVNGTVTVGSSPVGR